MESLEYCRAVYRMGRLNISADGIELLEESNDVLVTSVSIDKDTRELLELSNDNLVTSVSR